MPQHDVIDTAPFNWRACHRLFTHCQAAHFAVGYFFLSGFKLIAPYIAAAKAALLIGNTAT